MASPSSNAHGNVFASYQPQHSLRVRSMASTTTITRCTVEALFQVKFTMQQLRDPDESSTTTTTMTPTNGTMTMQEEKPLTNNQYLIVQAGLSIKEIQATLVQRSLAYVNQLIETNLDPTMKYNFGLVLAQLDFDQARLGHVNTTMAGYCGSDQNTTLRTIVQGYPSEDDNNKKHKRKVLLFEFCAQVQSTVVVEGRSEFHGTSWTMPPSPSSIASNNTQPVSSSRYDLVSNVIVASLRHYFGHRRSVIDGVDVSMLQPNTNVALMEWDLTLSGNASSLDTPITLDEAEVSVFEGAVLEYLQCYNSNMSIENDTQHSQTTSILLLLSDDRTNNANRAAANWSMPWLLFNASDTEDERVEGQTDELGHMIIRAALFGSDSNLPNETASFLFYRSDIADAFQENSSHFVWLLNKNSTDGDGRANNTHLRRVTNVSARAFWLPAIDSPPTQDNNPNVEVVHPILEKVPQHHTYNSHCVGINLAITTCLLAAILSMTLLIVVERRRRQCHVHSIPFAAGG